MSYPKELEEYSTDEIRKELARRLDAESRHECTYCRRPITNAPCKFANRHMMNLAVARRY